MPDAERITFSHLSKPGYQGKLKQTGRSSSLSVIALILGLKGLGLLLTVALAMTVIISQTHPEIVNIQPVLNGPEGKNAPARTDSAMALPTIILQTQIALLQTEKATDVVTEAATATLTKASEPSPTLAQVVLASDTATEPPIATMVITDTPAPSIMPTLTLEPVITSTFTAMPSNTPTITLTFTPSATIYPYSLTAYNGMMNTPLQGIGFGELHTIISQVYNVPDPHKDTGHHGVDLGSYDYHGKLIYDWPILSVFSGKVAGIVVNRYPIGNTIIIESTYDQLPSEIIKQKNIQPGQSLYHMYCHMLNEPALKVGDEVIVGKEIGRVGKTQTVEAHLHLEMVVGVSGKTFPSMAYYNGNATEEEKQAYLYWRTSGEFLSFDPMTIFADLK
jgi:murein DD-endopeptidase MepM/ murein hydrolase activator NlpD